MSKESSAPAVEFVKVSKVFNGQHVVRDISFRIEQGEFVALLGPSGCGKSTILKMICGIEDPTEGEIYVDGKLVNYTRPKDRDVAMVFQNYALYPHMSVAENIAYPLTTGWKAQTDRATRDKMVREVAKLVEVDSQLEKYPDQLSGGQRQRVALARAIIRKPAAYLMDEPLSNLDAKLRDSVRAQLISLHQAVGRATLYVTHDQIEAMTMADRIIVLNEGCIQQAADPRTLFQAPANLFVAKFIGTPQINLLPGKAITDNEVDIAGAKLKHCAAGVVPGSTVTVGLRPTDLSQSSNGSADNRIPGRIVNSIYAGADSYLEVALEDGARICVRARTDGPIPDGSARVLFVPPQEVHLFDTTGCRL